MVHPHVGRQVPYTIEKRSLRCCVKVAEIQIDDRVFPKMIIAKLTVSAYRQVLEPEHGFAPGLGFFFRRFEIRVQG